MRVLILQRFCAAGPGRIKPWLLEQAIGSQCLLQRDLRSIQALLRARPGEWLKVEHSAMPESVEDGPSIRAGLSHCSGVVPTLFRVPDFLSGPHSTLR